MNTKIICIAHRQPRLGGFVPSPLPKSTEESSSGGDDNDDADGLGSFGDDEMTTSQ